LFNSPLNYHRRFTGVVSQSALIGVPQFRLYWSKDIGVKFADVPFDTGANITVSSRALSQFHLISAIELRFALPVLIILPGIGLHTDNASA